MQCLILPANNLVWSLYIGQVRFIVQVKLVTDKQGFYDKFSNGTFYLSIVYTRVYVQQIFNDKFLVFWPPR